MKKRDTRVTTTRNSSDAPRPLPVQKPVKRLKARLARAGLVVVILAAVGVAIWLVVGQAPRIVERVSPVIKNLIPQAAPATTTGKVVLTEKVQSYTAAQTLALIKQTNPGYKGVAGGVQEQTFRYTMADPAGKEVLVYGRIFVPTTSSPSGNKLPVFAFAPGTTGIDDQCAASLEQPAVHNWANYPSHMVAYAAQGYIAVTTDYEGMRDPSRMHHYMVGELEGRAVLDSVRALKDLGLTQNRVDLKQVFLAGYSQGGHAALWGDRIAAQYAPELGIKGVIGFGPVTDVRQTVVDITSGANLIWFAPYVLYSYADWYGEKYDPNLFLLPPYGTNLATDIATHCIDTDIGHWGDKDSKKVLTAPFLAALKDGTLAQFAPTLNQRLEDNQADDYKTASAKLINQGRLDNVILPSQSETARQVLCGEGNKVTAKVYPQATHYTTMIQSFDDTLAWMKALRDGKPVAQSCN